MNTIIGLLWGCDSDKVSPNNKIAGTYDLTGSYDWEHLCACTPQVVDGKEFGPLSARLEILPNEGTKDKILLKGLKQYRESTSIPPILELPALEASIAGDSLIIPQQYPWQGNGLNIIGHVVFTEDSVHLTYRHYYRFTRCTYRLSGKR